MKLYNTTYVVYGTEVIKVDYIPTTNEHIETASFIWDENEHKYEELYNSDFYSAMGNDEASVIHDLIEQKVRESLGLLGDQE